MGTLCTDLPNVPYRRSNGKGAEDSEADKKVQEKVTDFLERAKMKPATSHVVVEVTLFVQTSAWGPDCTIAQAVDQATTEAKRSLERVIAQHPEISLGPVRFARVVCPAEAK